MLDFDINLNFGSEMAELHANQKSKLILMKSHFLFHQIFLQFPLKPHPAFSRQKNPDIFSDPTPNMTLASTGGSEEV